MDNTFYNYEAERIILGNTFFDPEVVKELYVSPEQFSAGKNQEIFKRVKEMDNKGIPIEIPAFAEYVGFDNLETVGGLTYLSELAASSFTTRNLNYYQDTVIDYYKKREGYFIGTQLVNGIEITEGIAKLQGVMEQTAPKSDGDIRPALKRIYEKVLTSNGGLTGIASKFKDLDKLTNGFQRKDLIVIAARPSMGKTAFSLSIAENVVKTHLKDGATVGFFSAEMSEDTLLMRMAASMSGIDTQDINNAKEAFSMDDWDRFGKAMDTLYNADLKIFDEAPMHLSYVWRNARELRRKNPDGDLVIIVDYLQLLHTDDKAESRRVEVDEISRSLKALAKDVDAPVIALSQLSRGVEQRQDKRPMMSDIRESGGIEQDADVICFLYREEYYTRDTEDQNLIEVIIGKQRNGPTGTVKLGYLKEKNRFFNIDWFAQKGAGV